MYTNMHIHANIHMQKCAIDMPKCAKQNGLCKTASQICISKILQKMLIISSTYMHINDYAAICRKIYQNNAS